LNSGGNPGEEHHGLLRETPKGGRDEGKGWVIRKTPGERDHDHQGSSIDGNAGRKGEKGVDH